MNYKEHFAYGLKFMYDHDKFIDDFNTAIQKNSAAVSEDMTQCIMIAFKNCLQVCIDINGN